MSARVIGICLAGDGHDLDRAFLEAVLGWHLGPDLRVVDGEGSVVAIRIDKIGGPPRWLPVVAAEPRELDSIGRSADDGFDLVVDDVGAELVTTGFGSELDVLLRDHPYIASDRAPGRASFLQLNTPDAARSADFYRSWLGWGELPSENDRFTYRYLSVDGSPHAGLLSIDERSGPVVPGWQIYVHSDDVFGAAATIREVGGEVLVGPMTIIGGDFLVARTPSGAAVALDDMTRHDDFV